MKLLIFWIIPFIIQCILIFQVKRRVFKKKDYTDKITIPLWGYLVYLILALIPIVSTITLFMWIWVLYNILQDFYYKPGWIIKLLQKEL